MKLELVNQLSELALEVTSLVSVDNMLLSELIEHSAYLRELSSCLCLVGSSTELANCVTCGLAIVTVGEVVGKGLLDALL